MKTKTSIFIFFCLTFLAVLSSCRSEEIESIQPPEDESLEANSTIANLMQRVSTNDGSLDNIIDSANCIELKLPLTVIANGIELAIESESDFDDIESIFDEFEEDTNTINIVYPATIILTDFTEIIINSSTEFSSYSVNCNGENEIDEDIECIDFQYPITSSIFDTNNELLDTVTITKDKELYDFIGNLEETIIVTITFPITMILSDGNLTSINNLTELETIIISEINVCDEDDDNNWNDDDCNTCTIEQLEAKLTSCTNWAVDKLKNDNTNYDSFYDGYIFNFFNDGTIFVTWSSTSDYGTWSTSGTANNLIVTINIPSLPFCNNDWLLQEINEGTEDSKINLVLNDEDRIRYVNSCN